MMHDQSSFAILALLCCTSVTLSWAKQCPLKGEVTHHKITFVNLKTIKTDGTAVAFIEDGACPVRIADKDALFEEDNKHHQQYKFKLSNDKKCEVEGYDVGPTTMTCKRGNVEDAIERLYVDEGYVAQPCPDGCDAECRAIDPDWEENALKMFGFKWEKKQTSTPKQTRTATVTSSKTASVRMIKMRR